MQYLYLNNMYCSKSDDVKKMLSDRANQMNKDFRKEVLALFRDGVLDNWFSEISSIDKTALDDNLFVDLVQTITGNTVSGDIRSKFNDVGELVRIEFGDKSYDVANGVVNITNFKPGNIKFIFKCLRPENNEFSFNYYNQTKKLNWNDYARNQEIALEFNSDNEGNFELKEGNGNVIVEIELSSIPDCAVDLGLSVYWADRNVGATKVSDDGLDLVNVKSAMGKGWRIPNEKEFEELNSKYICIENINHKECAVFSSNGSKLYLPVLDYRIDTKSKYFFVSKFGGCHINNTGNVFMNWGIRCVFDKN